MTNEILYFIALKRISAYLTPDRLKRQAKRLYGLSGEEAFEYAYENVLNEAGMAVKGKRMPKDDK